MRSRWRTLLRIIGKPFLLQSLAVLAVIEMIFLTESFEGLLVEALKYDASLIDFAKVIALQAPEIGSLGIAISMLVGTYFAVNTARTDHELTALSGAGIAAGHLIFIVCCFGVAGSATTVGLAGYLAPEARYLQRTVLEDLQVDYVEGQLLSQNATAFARDDLSFAIVPTQSGDPQAVLLIYDKSGDDQWTIGLANDWQVDRADGLNPQVTLEDFTIYKAQTGSETSDGARARSASVTLPMADFYTPTDATRQANERPIHETHSATISTTARALQALFAALLALCAVLTSNSTIGRLAALPIALLIVVSWEVAARGVLEHLATIWPLGTVILTGVVLTVGPPLLLLCLKGHALMVAKRA